MRQYAAMMHIASRNRLRVTLDEVRKFYPSGAPPNAENGHNKDQFCHLRTGIERKERKGLNSLHFKADRSIKATSPGELAAKSVTGSKKKLQHRRHTEQTCRC